MRLQKQNLKYITLFLCVIIFSGLGISSYSEGLDDTKTSGNSVVSGNSIVSGNSYGFTNSINQNPNYIYVVLFLVILIVWLFLIKQNNE
jgi:uncharacterized membrane protein YgaE (UPF0421/DUF939 family)